MSGYIHVCYYYSDYRHYTRCVVNLTGMAYCLLFQIGDEKDVMYFKTNTEKERKEWIESLGIGKDYTQ